MNQAEQDAYNALLEACSEFLRRRGMLAGDIYSQEFLKQMEAAVALHEKVLECENEGVFGKGPCHCGVCQECNWAASHEI